MGIYIHRQLVFTFKDSGHFQDGQQVLTFKVLPAVFMYMGAGIFVKFCVNL